MKQKSIISIIIFIITVFVVQTAVYTPMTVYSQVDSEDSQITQSNVATEETDEINMDDAEVLEVSAIEKNFNTTAYSINESMTEIARNNSFILYFDKKTTQIAVENTKDKSIWFSNPQDIDDVEGVQGSEKLRLLSQLDITIFDVNGQRKLYDNYTASISKDFFSFELIDDGVKVTYSFGGKKQIQVNIPQQISDERFKLLFLENDALNDEEKKEMESRFRYSETHNAWFWKTTSVESILQRLDEIMSKAGYTEEDYIIDSEDDEDKESLLPPDPTFELSIVYLLEDDGLVATVPLKEIEYPEGWFISEVILLKNFGAAYKSDEGYIFVPSGNGAIVNFDENSISPNQIFLKLYGEDATLDIRARTTYGTDAIMPVYGMKKGDSTFIAVIEKGDAMATVSAQRSSTSNPFNFVFPIFNLTNRGYIALGDGQFESQVITFQKDPYKEDLTVRFIFNQDESPSYSGMANNYRKYLIEKHNLEKIEPKADIPFFLETVGSIVKNKSFFGISYVGNHAMTTFEQTGQISDMLIESGISNIKIRLSGWFNAGREQDIASKIKPVRVIGGRRGFNKLLDYGNENDIEIYPEVKFLTTNRDNGFSIYNNSAKTLDQRFAKAYRYNVESDRAINFINPLLMGYQYIVAPSYLLELTDSFLKEYARYNNNYLALGDFGSFLHSDFNEKTPSDRQNTFEIIKNETEKLSESKKLMATLGNTNVIHSVHSLLEVPTQNKSYLIEDENVPFFQMVYHGIIEYAGNPLNETSFYRSEMLKTIEYGSGVYYKWTYRPSSDAKYTSSDDLFSTYYKDWMESAVSFYKEANEALKDLQNQFIVENRALSKDVKITVFENNKSIIVNYGKVPVTIDGIIIEAENFKVVEGGIGNE